MGDATKLDALWQPLNIGKVTIKNRLVMAPMMVQNYFDNDGNFNADGREFFEQRAQGGFGLLYTGAMTALTSDDQIGQNTPAPLKNPRTFVPAARRLTDQVHLYGSKIFGEITFGHGRVLGEPAPSSTPVLGHPDRQSKEMTTEQIEAKVEAIAQTAKVLQKAGFEGIDVHGLHWGYVLEQFAAELTNHRQDQYGGTLANRLRPCQEAVTAIKEACGQDYPVTIRLDMESFLAGLGQPTMDPKQEAGISIDQAVDMAKLLEQFGYDALMVDCGASESLFYGVAPNYMGKGFTIPMAKKIKAAVNIPVIITGSRIDEPQLMAEAVAPDTGDAVAVGRAALADPFLPQKLYQGNFDEVRPCIGCNQCIQSLLTTGRMECAVNPNVGHETEQETRALEPKRVVVVGGGLAGMEAARTLKRRGHHVTLYEATTVLGGDLIEAASSKMKVDIQRLNDWYQLQLKNLGIKVEMSHRLTTDELLQLKPDVAVLATGSMPRAINFPGSDDSRVIDSFTAIDHSERLGKRVTIIGGGQTGCELALNLAQHDHQVTVVESRPRVLQGPQIPIMNAAALQFLMAQNHVKILTNSQVVSYQDGEVNVKKNDGKVEQISADSVVPAVGLVSRPSLAKELAGTGITTYEVGDGFQVGDVHTTVRSAHEIAKRI